MEYEFSLKFKLSADTVSDDAIIERLGQEGCTDALAGVGLPGYVGLDFIREATSSDEAISSALQDVQTALPTAVLVEAEPDLVGLSKGRPVELQKAIDFILKKSDVARAHSPSPF